VIVRFFSLTNIILSYFFQNFLHAANEIAGAIDAGIINHAFREVYFTNEKQ